MDILKEIDDEQQALVKELNEMFGEDYDAIYSQLIEMVALCHVFIHKNHYENDFDEFLNEANIEVELNKDKDQDQ